MRLVNLKVKRPTERRTRSLAVAAARRSRGADALWTPVAVAVPNAPRPGEAWARLAAARVASRACALQAPAGGTTRVAPAPRTERKHHAVGPRRSRGRVVR